MTSTAANNAGTSQWNRLMLDGYDPSMRVPPGDGEYLPGTGAAQDQTSAVAAQYARREHQSYDHVPINASLAQLGLLVSPSVRWQFTYQTVLQLKNCFIGCLGLVWTAFYVQSLMDSTGLSATDVLFHAPTAPILWMSVSRMPDYLVPWWYAFVVTNCILSFAWVFVARWYIVRKQREVDVNQSNYNTQATAHPLGERMGRGGTDLAVDPVEDLTLHDNIKGLAQQQAAISPGIARRYVGVASSTSNATSNSVSVKPQNHTRTSSVVSDNVATKPITPDDTTAMDIPVQLAVNKPSLAPLETEHTTTRHVMDWHREKHWMKKMVGWSKSFTMFASLVAAQAVVNYYAYLNAPTFDSQLLLSLIISVGLLMFNLVWKHLSNYATSLELHTYVSTFLTSSFLKTQLFKLTTTVVVFNISQLRLFLPASEDVSDLAFPNNCLFDNMTSLFAINICTDLVSTIVTTLVLPAISNMTTKCRSRHSTFGESELRPMYSLPDQASQMLYSEALVVLATPDFPLYPLLSCMWMWMRGYTDRIYLLRFCRPVVMTNNNNRDTMMVMNIVSVLVMIIVPPNAALWLLVSWADQCVSLFG